MGSRPGLLCAPQPHRPPSLGAHSELSSSLVPPAPSWEDDGLGISVSGIRGKEGLGGVAEGGLLPAVWGGSKIRCLLPGSTLPTQERARRGVGRGSVSGSPPQPPCPSLLKGLLGLPISCQGHLPQKPLDLPSWSRRRAEYVKCSATPALVGTQIWEELTVPFPQAPPQPEAVGSLQPDEP